MLSILGIPTDNHDNQDGDVFTTSELSQLKYDGLENLAGFVAFKLRNKEKLGYIPDASEPSSSWVNYLSEGGLMKPTDSFLIKCRLMNSVFEKFNGDSLKICKNYIKNLLQCSEHVDLSKDAKSLFFRCKMYFRIRILNCNLKEHSNVRKRKFSKITT